MESPIFEKEGVKVSRYSEFSWLLGGNGSSAHMATYRLYELQSYFWKQKFKQVNCRWISIVRSQNLNLSTPI
jgi:hypothetical protein